MERLNSYSPPLPHSDGAPIVTGGSTKFYTMKRISKETKAIADAHIRARSTGTFDNPRVNSKDELLAALKDGKTFEQVLEEIEYRFCGVGQILISRHFTPSQNYKAGIYKGFKTILP
jgi:hypothetical protein